MSAVRDAGHEAMAGGIPPIERHPFEPFIPKNSRLLMLGSFPPSEKRWAMEFYYPNFTNDMWRIFGLCFYGDKTRLVDVENKTFRLDEIVCLLRERGIALYDTAQAVRRLKNTASDKDLEVVEPSDIASLLRLMPSCGAVGVTGQKAADTLCTTLGIDSQPKVGAFVDFDFNGRPMRFYRMPSSSRAYPMAVECKAEYYLPMFQRETGL